MATGSACRHTSHQVKKPVCHSERSEESLPTSFVLFIRIKRPHSYDEPALLQFDKDQSVPIHQIRVICVPFPRCIMAFILNLLI